MIGLDLLKQREVGGVGGGHFPCFGEVARSTHEDGFEPGQIKPDYCGGILVWVS